MIRQGKTKPSVTHAGRMPWKIRAIQIDVARSIETVDTIRRYTDNAAEQGFNTLVLYLEARVRTAVFPFRPADQSYTLEEMHTVVSHANAAGLDVVPVISTLGHCEQFVRCPEMAHLAETREGKCRFGRPNASTMCPSLDESYEFFQRYFSELAQVFTGPHWHAGMDESWDMGFCPQCRAHWEKEGLGALFTRHLLRTHALVTGLGKRMWIWDDMYELFPEQLAAVPRDTVMCHWCYDDVIEPEGAQAHFVNRWRQDWLGLYEREGLDAVVCPAIGAPLNIETITGYARRHRVLGGLLTQWGGPIAAHAGNSTIVSFTGNLWKTKDFDPERAWQAAIQTVIPGATSALANTVEILTKNEGYGPSGAMQSYFAGPLYKEEIKRRDLMRTALHLLRAERAAHPPRGGADVLDHMDRAACRELLHWDLREILPRIYDPRRPDADAPLLRRKVAALRKELVANHPKVDVALKPAWQRLARKPKADDWWLVLRLFLPDVFGAGQLKVTITAGGKNQVIAEHGFKPPYALDQAGRLYTIQIPFTSSKVPDGVRLEGTGYGGQGVAFVEAQNPLVTLFPHSLRKISGPVERPDAVMRDDATWAYLGCPDILAAIHLPELAAQRGVLDIGLAPRPIA